MAKNTHGYSLEVDDDRFGPDDLHFVPGTPRTDAAGAARFVREALSDPHTRTITIRRLDKPPKSDRA